MDDTNREGQNVGLSALLGRPTDAEMLDWLQARASEGCVTMCFEIDGGVHVTLDPCGGEQTAAREVETVRDGIDVLMRPKVNLSLNSIQDGTECRPCLTECLRCRNRQCDGIRRPNALS